jgi:DNA-binding transcriptional LysR family regulator
MQKKKEIDLEKSSRFRYLDWDKIKTFYYVSKLGSFTKTSEFLHLSQPALSRQISSMERILGCPLFTRQSRGLQLTRKGEQLFSYAESMYFGIVEFTHTTHAEMATSKKRKIRIATTHAITAYILDDLIFAYNEQHPHLVFELISADHLIDVVLNDVDIAIRPHDPERRGIQQEHLFTLEKKLYVSPEYLKKYGEPQSVDDLKNHRIIAPAHPEDYPYAELNWILNLGMSKGKQHEPVFTANSIESLIKAAKRGLGIIGSYEEMEIVKNSHLKNILPEVKEKKINEYFIYPDYLQEDQEIIALKTYLHAKLNFNEN